MQFDQTHVAIRLRTLSEIADLALVMVRQYSSALFVGFTLGCLPWMVCNALLLSWLPIRESQYGMGDVEARYEMVRYTLWMGLLVIAQTPAAGVLTTYYLGQAVFEKRPTWSAAQQQVRKQFWSWFWSLGIVRLPVPIMLLLLLRVGTEFDPSFDGFWWAVLAIVVVVQRCARPFLPEALLLEQCPRKSDNPAVVTLGRRMKSLHSPVAGDLTSRMFAVGFVLIAFWIATYYSLAWFRGIALGQWNTDLFALLVILPLSMWLVAGVSVIIRLLSYLDTRIRMEGWEVELAVRAEAMRQFGEDPQEVPKQSRIESTRQKPLVGTSGLVT